MEFRLGMMDRKDVLRDLTRFENQRRVDHVRCATGFSVQLVGLTGPAPWQANAIHEIVFSVAADAEW